MSWVSYDKLYSVVEAIKSYVDNKEVAFSEYIQYTIIALVGIILESFFIIVKIMFLHNLNHYKIIKKVKFIFMD